MVSLNPDLPTNYIPAVWALPKELQRLLAEVERRRSDDEMRRQLGLEPIPRCFKPWIKPRKMTMQTLLDRLETA